MGDEEARFCSHDDDAFDALVYSLIARAAAIGLTGRPSAADAELARKEGWIAVPLADSLPRLVGGKPAEARPRVAPAP